MGKSLKKQTAFIILNYNDYNTTMSLVDSLCGWKLEKNQIQVVVVDNYSTDGSYDKLFNRYADNENVDIIQSEKNGGYSYGNNFGAKFAIKKYQIECLAIANPDIRVEEGMFLELLKTFEKNETIAMAAPVMKNLNGDYQIQSLDLPEYVDDLKFCFGIKKSRLVKERDFEYLDNDETMIVTKMLPGSFFVIKAACFEQMGMFDENTFLFCEERILGKKIHEKGWKVVLRSDLFFVHAHSVTIKKHYDLINTWKILMSSRVYYEKKYNRINFIQSMILSCSVIFYLCMLKLKFNVYDVLKNKG